MRGFAVEITLSHLSRGDDTIKLYMWMDKLRDQAKAVGGTVLSHLGNHEWMNAIGDWRSVQEFCSSLSNVSSFSVM